MFVLSPASPAERRHYEGQLGLLDAVAAIDTLKETVPIWKKEVTRDGQYWVDDRA